MAYRIRVFMTAVVVASIVALPAQANSDRIALVIGNAAYDIGALRNPVNDAKAVAEGLSTAGYDVRHLENATQREILNAVRIFSDEVAFGVSIAVFYYAGHGVQIDGRNYLIPVDSDIRSEDEIEFFAIDAGLVLSKMENAGQQTNVVILDACRDNPFPSRTRSATRGLSVIPAPAGSIVVYSTAPGSVALDGDGSHGVFTEALLRHMNTPNVDIEMMLRRVKADVVEATGGAQVPWSNSSLTTEVALTGNVATAQSEAPQGTATAVPAASSTVAPSAGAIAPSVADPADIATLLVIGNGSIAAGGMSWAIVPDRVLLNAVVGVSYWSYGYSADSVDGLLATTDVELRWEWFRWFFSPFLGVGMFASTDFDIATLSGEITAGLRFGRFHLRGAVMYGAVNHTGSYPSGKLGVGFRL